MSVVTFSTVPKGIVSGGTVRFYDNSYLTGEEIVSWDWDFGDGTTHSTEQNPTHTYPASATDVTYTVVLTVTGSNSTSASCTYTNGIFELASTTSVLKPTTTIYNRCSVLLYNGDNATLINRETTANNNLILMDCKCTNSINRAGTATIKVIDWGDATATETSLLTSTYTTDTNVAILVGYDIIWSGRILRSTQGKMSMYSETTTIKEYTIECESDITKMGNQNVASTAYGNNIASVGKIATTLCNNAVSGDIQWIDYITTVPSRSTLSFEGPPITFNITNKDMFTQFQSLAKVCGFDWRTRIVTRRYTYSAYDSSTKVISATTNTATNALVGHWVIFINPTGDYLLAYGRVTSNDTSSITCTTITNNTLPATSSQILVMGNPILDFSPDISEPEPSVAYLMNAPDEATVWNGYEFDDKSDRKSLITKVIAISKSSIPIISSGASSPQGTTITSSLVAKDAWETGGNFFQNSTYVTHKSQGYIYSYAGGSDVVLIGQDWVFWAPSPGTYGGVIFCGLRMDGTPIDSNAFYGISNVTTQVQSDGTPTTTLHFGYTVDPGYTWVKYSFAIAGSLYVKESLSPSGLTNMNCGGDTLSMGFSGVHPVYGNYMSVAVFSGGFTYPHGVGSLVSLQTYSESSPQAGSPLVTYGNISKTIPVDTFCTRSDLDNYVLDYLLANSYYYQRASFWCHPYDFTIMDIPKGNASNTPEFNYNLRFLYVGQRISVTTTTGGTTTEYQIVDWTYNANELTVDVTLGDFDRNTFTILGEKTAALEYNIT